MKKAKKGRRGASQIDGGLVNDSWWSQSADVLLDKLKVTQSGLTADEAARRYVPEPAETSRYVAGLKTFLNQFRNPLMLLLLFALILSAGLREFSDSIIIFSILFISALLSAYQERRATAAAKRLRALIRTRSTVRRGGVQTEIPTTEVVQGDIVLLQAGDIVPCDGMLLSEKDLYISESSLTGESYPAEKSTDPVSAETPLAKRKNCVFMGSAVLSGTGEAIAVATGGDTQLGVIGQLIRDAEPETAFEKSLREFGRLLMRTGLVIAGVVMIWNISAGRPPLDSILFSLALSVGLAPEMLPAIVTITLSMGARRMSEKRVIVKKLSAVQNLGNITVLCSDKTGTLTEGAIRIHSFVPLDGKSNDKIRLYAYLNSLFESGYPNPIDIALRAVQAIDDSGYMKQDEVPYDFTRKRLSVVVGHGGKSIMITKGALKNVLDVCSTAEYPEPATMTAARAEIMKKYADFSAQGLRTIGICYKDVTGDAVIDKSDEVNMIFLGFVLLHDPLKQDIGNIVSELKAKDVALKIITGDNLLIAASVASQLGLEPSHILSGADINRLNDGALAVRCETAVIFAETEPVHKERIVRALQSNRHVVGYLGDGINDAPALKQADVGISVNTAVDVARESADIILLERDLGVISDGITEGRKTFANTLKYIYLTISANFGNMFSMAIASAALPFLPMLPSQILLLNFITDFPALSLASDRVDPPLLLKPGRWDMRVIRRFMIVFGLQSSLFDMLAFALLYFGFKANESLFQSGWFMESALTELVIIFVIRSADPFRSRPGTALLAASAFVLAITILLPFTPLALPLGMTSLPGTMLSGLFAIVIVYFFSSLLTRRLVEKHTVR